ncbi:MAG TPA: ATP-binding protein [Gaiellaceae bacterium]|nr:ATP-binding protein [Gaiellaceae bacterium]
MTRRLLVGFLALTVLVLVVLEVPLAVSHRQSAQRDLTARVEHDAVALASLAQPPLAASRRPGLASVEAVAADYAERTGGRVVVVDADGTAVLDTSPEFGAGRDFATRPEVAAALRGETASGIRRSNTLGTGLLYVAVPVAAGGRVLGAVRVTYPTSELDRRVWRYRLVLLATAAVVLGAAAIVGLGLARWIDRPLARVREAAETVGDGRLDARAPVDGPPEVRALALALNETTAKLESLLESQEAFVADASHQLRTPLTALRLRLETLEHDVTPAGRPDLEAALAEVERLGGLVDELLALARADSAAAPAGPLPLAPLLHGRAEAWTPLAAERAVRVEAAAADGVAARAAAVRVEQVLDNLLANALAVSPPGGTVRLEARPAGPWVELHVVDEGPGLSPEARRRAFDRFWRGPGGDRAGRGSGLGLAIVRRLVAADDGEVELLDAPRGGVDAVVRLRPL